MPNFRFLLFVSFSELLLLPLNRFHRILKFLFLPVQSSNCLVIFVSQVVELRIRVSFPPSMGRGCRLVTLALFDELLFTLSESFVAVFGVFELFLEVCVYGVVSK